MKIANIPSKFTIPFANAAGGGYIRAVPTASQVGITNGAASLTDGFPPLNFLPVGSGGVPPFGQDMNGILKQITQWSQWAAAGGLSPYDSAFSTAIGGYPQNSVIAGTVAGSIYISLIDDNTSNPNTGGAGWSIVPTAAGIQNNLYTYSSDGGGAGSIVATLSPAPTAYVTGMSLEVKVAATCSGATTINVNGLGPKQVGDISGTTPISGSWQTGNILQFIYDGTVFRVISGGRSLPAVFSTSYSTSFGVSNNVLTQCIIAASSGTASFGTYTTTTFTFTRAGTYAIAGSSTVNMSTSSATNCAGVIQLRQNGSSISGGASGDSTYLPTATSIGFTQYTSGVINAAAGDTITVYASIGANTGFSSGNIAASSLNITLIS